MPWSATGGRGGLEIIDAVGQLAAGRAGLDGCAFAELVEVEELPGRAVHREVAGGRDPSRCIPGAWKRSMRWLHRGATSDMAMTRYSRVAQSHLHEES